MGRYFVFEGIDGSGKTTAAANVKEMLEHRGLKVDTYCYPTKTKVGAYIRNEFLNGGSEFSLVALQHLFMADYAESLPELFAKRDACDVLICDRHPLVSSWAYSGLDLPMLMRITMPDMYQAARPDLTILFHVNAETALHRIRLRGGEQSVFDKAKYDVVEARRSRYAAWHMSTLWPTVAINGEASPTEVAREVGRQLDFLEARLN